MADARVHVVRTDYNPIIMVGSVGFEPTTSSAPGSSVVSNL
jgi:hypothetical protein